MGSSDGWGDPLGKLGVNWEVCEAMPSRDPKAHRFTNPTICFLSWI